MDPSVIIAGWSNQAETFLKLIDAYKTKQMFCDCTIACREKMFYAHKIVLSMCSEFFEKILLSTQDKNPVIILHEIEAWQLECILSFMYKGETHVSEVKFPSLLKIAKYLQIKGFDDEGILSNSTLEPHINSYFPNHVSNQETPLNMSLPSKNKDKEDSRNEYQPCSTIQKETTNHERRYSQSKTSSSKQIGSISDLHLQSSSISPYQDENKNLPKYPSTEPFSNYNPEAFDRLTHRPPPSRAMYPPGVPRSYPYVPSDNSSFHSQHCFYPPAHPYCSEHRNYAFNHSHLCPKDVPQGKQMYSKSTTPVEIRNQNGAKITMQEVIKTEEDHFESNDLIQVESGSSDEENDTHDQKEEVVNREDESSSQPDTCYSFNNNKYKTSKPGLRKPPPLIKISNSPICTPNENSVQNTDQPEVKSVFKSPDPLLEKIPTNKRKRVRGPKSWEFLLRLLKSPTSNPSLIKWEDEEASIFRLIRPEVIAQRWGQRTGKHIHDVLSYESFSRGLRYHYATGALCAVSEKSFVYQFGPKAQKCL